MDFALTHVLTTRLVLGSRLYGWPDLKLEFSRLRSVVVDWVADWAVRCWGFAEAIE
jgi:hypothetical protein